MTVLEALLAGLAAGIAVLAAMSAEPSPAAAAIFERRQRRPATAGSPRVPKLAGRPAAWLRVRLERAGWAESPERYLVAVAAATLALAAAGGCLGAVMADAPTAAGLALAGAAGGVAGAFQLLRGAARERRQRLLAELAPTLDLVGIELSAGTPPLVALASVSRRTNGALARELRRVLAAGTLGGEVAPDQRLQELGERLDLPPLVAVAMILATSREYGSGVAHGVRALAVDLRRSRRRDLIAASRRALSRVLVPSAVGVLLPFMAVLLYPAVTALAASFR